MMNVAEPYSSLSRLTEPQERTDFCSPGAIPWTEQVEKNVGAWAFAINDVARHAAPITELVVWRFFRRIEVDLLKLIRNRNQPVVRSVRIILSTA